MGENHFLSKIMFIQNIQNSVIVDFNGAAVTIYGAHKETCARSAACGAVARVGDDRKRFTTFILNRW